MGDAIDPDLAVADGAFEAFAQAVVATVLGAVPGGEAAAVADAGGAVEGMTADGPVAGGAADAADGGSALAGEGADALYTLPDGSISFSGYGIDGTSYSFGVD
ncbi:MAG: hypothetical protein AB7J32_19645 [Pseudonocardia sp.]